MMIEHDFASAWHNLTAKDPNFRGDTARDLAFWQAHAQGYEQSATAPGRYEETLAAIQSYLRPTDTVLDVGAGTGRFAVPLAQHVQQITALDHAPPMLSLLEQKIKCRHISNIQTITSAWETANVDPHDVVLVAWSLYRMADIYAGIKKLIATTKRTLIIVTSPGNATTGAVETPMHTYFYGVLWQAGIHADLRIVWEQPADSDKPVPVALLVWQRTPTP